MELAEFEHEVDSIIQRFGVSVNSPFKATRPRTQMSSAEQHAYLKVSDLNARSERRPKAERPNSARSGFKENVGLKALSVAKAMRALQDRIKALETEKTQLTQQLNQAEVRLSAERAKLQSRVIEEASHASVKEKAMLSHFSAVEAENVSLHEQCRAQQEQLKIMEAQVKILQNENRHLTELCNLDRGNSSLQLMHAERELGVKREVETRHLKEVASLKERLGDVQEELRSTKLSFDKLSVEASFARRTEEQQRAAQAKDFDQIEAAYTQQIQEQARCIKHLELQGRQLKDQVKAAERTADYWKRESQLEVKPGKLIRAHSQTKTPTSEIETALKKPHERRRKSTNKHPLGDSSMPPYPAFSHSVATSEPFSVIGLDQASQSEVQALELEIAALSRQSKQLLTKSGIGAFDLSTLRIELDAIAERMETKTNRLYSLKRGQQALLKSRMPYM